MSPMTLSANSITGTDVVNPAGEDLGDVKDLVINLSDGKVSYVVLSYGGFLGMGDKLFAVPWDAFTIDTTKEKFMLNVSKEKLENAPGFDKDNWPNHPTHEYLGQASMYFGDRGRDMGERAASAM